MTITVPADEMVRGYEALRAQAVGQIPSVTPRGLTLFLRAGLADWMLAYAPLGAAAASARAHALSPPPPPVALDGELVQVLTAMALGSRQRCPE